ncbi:MAG: SagB family peptide dehydrogenase [Candidatus Marinarcus sp.]|uniref:SagB family peptide dehydrogenase n=1 Tax=Candidatus Marinarcus sp. TaxID=3100987 RepID=UPI003B007AFF
MDFKQNMSYHEQTKHSYYSVRSNPNRLDWDHQPTVFKSYPKQYKRLALNLDNPTHSFIYYIASINATKSYPGVEYYLRINPSAGALYPNEIYFQSRNNKDIPDGIYHLDIRTTSLSLLKELNEDGIEPYLNMKEQINGFIFFVSAVYYRSSWKYKNRAFRYCLLDAGHLLGCIEMSAYIHHLEYNLVYDCNHVALNTLFGFDSSEFFLSSVVVGSASKIKVTPIKLDLPLVDGSYYFEENLVIENAYKKSVKIKNPQRQIQKPAFNFQKEVLKQGVLQRRSIRDFTRQAIKKEEFLKILELLTEPICSDCDETIDIYCVINRVKDMPMGLYKDHTYVKEGDFSSKAGYLCLEQELGKSSAVTFFLVSTSQNYQAMYQKAGIIGHRLYIASNYLQIGCSGIGAYYDDEVCEFIGAPTQVLYALAIGN